MTEIYNVSQLSSGTNIVEWLVIINDWTGGIVISAFILSIVLLMFSIMKMNNVETDDALIATGFIGFLITGVAWMVRFADIGLVPTIVPVMCMIACGVGVALKITGNSLST
jgi:putative copper export protein